MARAAVLAPRRENLPWGIPASVVLHMLLLALFALLPPPMRPKRPQDEPVSVEILTPGQLRPAEPTLAASTIPAQVPPTVTAPTRPTEPPPPAMIHPTQMLSAKTLADPRSRQVRADLATFASEDRMSQLCNIEAMDQIHKWKADFQPDRVVAYATAGEKIRGTTIRADGAAFRSRKNWYALKFNCELSPDGESVIGFEFLVGDPVPQERWDELGLPAVH
ncbi:MAG: DUF930 domain-containing protein [Pseudomonadota bacterium]